MPIDFLRYISNPTPIQPLGIAESVERLQQRKLQHKQLAEQQRQFDVTAQATQGRHEDTMQARASEESGRNSRFELTLNDNKQARAELYSREDAQKLRDTIKAARQAMASGDYRQAMALAGDAKDLGADVNIATEGGKFDMRIAAPAFDAKPGRYDMNQEIPDSKEQSTNNKNKESRPLTNDEIVQQSISETGVAPPPGLLPFMQPVPQAADVIRGRNSVQNQVDSRALDTLGAQLGQAGAAGGAEGVLRQAAAQNTAVPGALPVVGSPGDVVAPAASPMPGDALRPPAGGSAGDVVAPPSGSQQLIDPSDPRLMRQSVLEEITARRLNPVISGLVGGIPSRYQDEARSLLEPYTKAGYDMPTVLKLMQPSFGTAASLWRSQDAISAAAQRMNQTQQRGDDAQDVRWYNIGRSEGSKIASSHKINERIENPSSFKTARDLISARDPNNPNQPNGQAQVNGVVRLIALNQSRISNEDFVLQVGGFSSDIQNFQDAVTHITRNGLSPHQERNLLSLIDSIQEEEELKAKNAYRSYRKAIGNSQHQKEAEALYSQMDSLIPEEYRTIAEMEEARKQAKSKPSSTGDSGSRSSSSKSVSSSATGPKAEEVDVNAGFNQFMKQE
jgi:hypothetical protein